MQKIFMKFTIAVTSIAVFSILVINLAVKASSLEKQQLITFQSKIGQVIHTLKNNQAELDAIMRNLDEDYLTRAKAAAYVLDKNRAALNDTAELKNLASLLNVDEIHVTGKEGIIKYSSVPQYIGLDFHFGVQMKEFLPLIESDDPEAYLIQEAMPNTAEEKMMKYVGVARMDEKGMVQVGLEPVRQLEAQEKNTYEYLFSRFPVEYGEQLFAVDLATEKVIGATLGPDGTKPEPVSYDVERLKNYEDGGFAQGPDGSRKYLVTRIYGDTMICAALSGKNMSRQLLKSVFLTFLYLVVIEISVLCMLNYLVRKKVLSGIHGILGKLSKITEGDLDTVVEGQGNPELEALGTGINAMVKSIVNTGDRISRIVDMLEIPLAAFEYVKNMKCVFFTSRLKELLHMTAEEADYFHSRPEEFLACVRAVMCEPVCGENDVYCMEGSQYISIRLSVEETGYYGTVMDVTENILEKKRMKYENNHDQLTGLRRFVYFKKEAEKILAGNGPKGIYACVMMDVDAFKQVNDTYGHDMGDKYLKNFAEILKKLPRGNCSAARRSGDEFSLFLYGFRKKEEIDALLRNIWSEIKSCRIGLEDGQQCEMSVSGGYAWSDDASVSDISPLLAKADAALYAVKREKKGTYAEYSCPESD